MTTSARIAGATSNRPSLTPAQKDRAAGTLVGLACGDALGAGYEFGPPLADDVAVGMVGGGGFGWAPGEWTDDTSMAIAIAQAAASGDDLRDERTLDGIVAEWVRWAQGAPDVGAQTRAVLSAISSDPTAANARAEAQLLHERTGRTAGNGSLMRTAPVALALIREPDDVIAATARTISDLTHADPEAGDACVVVCLAIAAAVRSGDALDLRRGLAQLPDERRATWAQRINEAEASTPRDFSNNGWVVHALQAAWSAIATTAVPDDDPATGEFACQHLQRALEAAVRGGHDTDTVAAIAGSMLGAQWGRSAVPFAWWRVLHGWPNFRARDVSDFGVLCASGGRDDADGWPSISHLTYGHSAGTATVLHLIGDDLWLGAAGQFDQAVDAFEIDAIVSLCRMGWEQVPQPGIGPLNHPEFWLIDGPAATNPNAAFVLHEAAHAVATLRAEGRTVLLHCAYGESRSPTVAALVIARKRGIGFDAAWRELADRLPHIRRNPDLIEAAKRLAPSQPVQ